MLFVPVSVMIAHYVARTMNRQADAVNVSRS
jgi:hypothetical protein